MLLRVLYVSPPCAARAARARSIGELLAVMATAGVGSLAPPGATAFALVSAVLVAVSVCEKTEVVTHNARVSSKSFRKCFFMGMVPRRVNGTYRLRQHFGVR